MAKNKVIKKWFNKDICLNIDEKKTLISINKAWKEENTENIKSVNMLSPVAYILLENEVSKHHVSLIMDINNDVYHSFSNVVYNSLYDNVYDVINTIKIEEVKSKNGYSYICLEIEGENNDAEEVEF